MPPGAGARLADQVYGLTGGENPIHGVSPPHQVSTRMTLANTQYADAITKVGGYYNFVTLINRRLKELNNGQPPMVLPPAEKNWDKIDLIVKEIEAGLLVLKTT
jgi:hypothetical protein